MTSERNLYSGRKLDIFYLALCWALTLTTSTLLTTIGPLAAKEVDTSDALAPLTIGVFLFGAAFSAVPSGEIFHHYGRFWGFTIGCVCQLCGSGVGAIGMAVRVKSILFVGCFLVGLGQGLGQFYRFAAVEISPSDMKSNAVTYVLSGGIVAAVLGPTAAKYSSNVIQSTPYTGSFLVMAFLGIVNWIILACVQFPVGPSKDGDGTCAIASTVASASVRPLVSIVKQPLFVLSCSIATIAHTVMVMVMSNCALSMSDDYTLGTASTVLEVHFLAMFLPGFCTGFLIKAYGTFNIAVVGAIVYALSAGVFAEDTYLMNYYIGMALLGLGWNLSYSSATIMLTGCYSPAEAPHVQATNDFILFTTSGCGCLLSGILFAGYSWSVLIYVASGLMGLNFLLFVFAWNINTDTLKDRSADSHSVAAISGDQEDRRPSATGEYYRLLSDDDKDDIIRSVSGGSGYDTDAESLDRVRQLSVA